MVIYGILNRTNRKYYIGSTTNFDKRKKEHLKSLRSNRHHSYLLQEDWNEDLFDFVILEEVVGRDDLKPREQWWIDNMDSFYNICKLSDSSLGVVRREETKEKLRQANLGLKHPEWRNKLKSIAQGGENHWTKKKRFSDEARKNMSESQKKLYKNGYVHPLRGKKVADESKLKMRMAKLKFVEQYDLSGNLLKIYEGIKEVVKDGFSMGAVVKCCKNRKESYKDFIWKYSEKKVA